MDKCVSEPAQAYNGKTALLVDMGLSRILDLQVPCVSPGNVQREGVFWPCRVAISGENIAG